MVSKKTKITYENFKPFDTRAEQGRAVARAIDNKTRIRCLSRSGAQFRRFFLPPKRYELLRLSKSENRSIAELAVSASRDRSAVSKDIAKLVDLGLVSVIVESNAGYGVKKIVRPVAEYIEIRAAAL